MLLAASGTTAAIGVALALYHVDLRAERANLADQHETVAELNKRLTVLHRVNRHNLGNELTVVRGHIDLFLEGTPTRRLNARSRPFTSTSAGSGP